MTERLPHAVLDGLVFVPWSSLQLQARYARSKRPRDVSGV
jgi:hypothetical protein